MEMTFKNEGNLCDGIHFRDAAWVYKPSWSAHLVCTIDCLVLKSYPGFPRVMECHEISKLSGMSWNFVKIYHMSWNVMENENNGINITKSPTMYHLVSRF